MKSILAPTSIIPSVPTTGMNGVTASYLNTDGAPILFPFSVPVEVILVAVRSPKHSTDLSSLKLMIVSFHRFEMSVCIE